MSAHRAFTMIELLLAVLMVGVITALVTMTFSAITGGWQASADYIDKLARTDYALDRISASLKSCYYPHGGSQDYAYGFYLDDKGDGSRVEKSDIVSWRTKSKDTVSSTDAHADSVYRVQFLMLEEGDNDYAIPIKKTGLYSRTRIDEELAPKDDADEDDFTFENKKLYPPQLISDAISGFNCRVMKEPPSKDTKRGENDESAFEDTFEASNSVPYKVELTFYLADREHKNYRRKAAPIMKIIRIPLYEQSLSGSETPSQAAKSKQSSGGGRKK